MSEPASIPMTSNTKMLSAMVGIGIFCGLLIVLTYEGTLPRVERLRAEALERAIFKVLPGINETKTFSFSDGQFIQTDQSEGTVIYAGYDEAGDFKGIAIEASGQGYADIIKILYGYDPINQIVIGFYVLESKETPGLGDKIEKDENFLANFTALDVTLDDTKSNLINSVIPVKSGTKENAWEVDGITGATISSRAIAEIIDKSAKQWLPIINQNIAQFNE